MPNVDGITLMPILHPNSNQTQPLRQAFLVEHQGEYTPSQPGCPQYKGQDMSVSSFYYMILRWGLGEAFLVEHQGEYAATMLGCPKYRDQDIPVSLFCYMILRWGGWRKEGRGRGAGWGNEVD